ncbi:MAG: transcription antitermination factor NusB [Gemmataceae bacterium]|nr:transcription antitermination factor NusB [Gemmataceae bacterium]
MYRRSRAREVALQLLFQRDWNPSVDRSAVERFARERLRDERSITYCLRLIDALTERGPEVDRKVEESADNWKLPRMAATDRNVLRLGVIELLLDDPETPQAVVLDEAIELARRFGGAESSKFVNGVLDRVRKSLAAPQAD